MLYRIAYILQRVKTVISVCLVTMETLVEEQRMTVNHVPAHCWKQPISSLLLVSWSQEWETTTTTDVTNVQLAMLETDVKGQRSSFSLDNFWNEVLSHMN